MLRIVRRFAHFCIAKIESAFRHAGRLSRGVDVRPRGLCAMVLALAGMSGAHADEAASAPAPETRRWVAVPKVQGRLSARDIGLVINTADPYSVEVGAYYAQQRKLSPQQILEVALPLRSALTRDEFDALAALIRAHFGPRVQALALAWTQPYAVQCNSITGALALGFDEALCQQTCARSRASPYFNSPSARPLSDHALRPAMLLAARDVPGAKALIDRGVRADGSLGLRGAPPVVAEYVASADAARNVRSHLFPPPQRLPALGVEVRVEGPGEFEPGQRVLLHQSGVAREAQPARIGWVDGALADHLTSFGGQLERRNGSQMSVLEWIESGATASYGTVSEPCNHLQKFPHPQLLLLHYLQGSTALEAYWKSVAWPQQGVFVGEPLAAPFARR
jgi:uncharacterized protein (TIGR03790 family)